MCDKDNIQEAVETTTQEILAEYQEMPISENQDEGEDLIKVEEA